MKEMVKHVDVINVKERLTDLINQCVIKNIMNHIKIKTVSQKSTTQN